jgi:hypothetical protein
MDLTKETQARIHEVQRKSDEMGIEDIKFFKMPSWNDLSREERAVEICDWMEAYFNGDFVKAEPLNDKVCPN